MFLHIREVSGEGLAGGAVGPQMFVAVRQQHGGRVSWQKVVSSSFSREDGRACHNSCFSLVPAVGVLHMQDKDTCTSTLDAKQPSAVVLFWREA